MVSEQTVCLSEVFLLKGYLSSVWISMEQSVMVSGTVYVFLGFVVVIGHAQLSLLTMGGTTGAKTTIYNIDNYIINYILYYIYILYIINAL